MKNFVLKNMKELEDMLYVRNLDLSRVVVDTIIENIDKSHFQLSKKLINSIKIHLDNLEFKTFR